MRRLLTNLFVVLLYAAAMQRAAADAYDPPTNYYAAATGTGATLKGQLQSIMSTGQVMRTYGDIRYSSSLQDVDPNHPGNILLVYDRSSVSGAWDPDDLPWNREHLWPQARQPGSLSNDSTGSLADPHALRPADPTINSNRGNMPFGGSTLSGAHGDGGGGYYYPGNVDRGDVARALFYDETRYSANGLSLTNSFPSGNQMGQLSSLVAWNYLDPPDDFERRRNQIIYSQSLNPSYYTNNRNAYVDNPEFVWSAYMNNTNDSRISINGATINGNGSSALAFDLGRRLKGSAAPAGQEVTIDKAGLNGTYFRVTLAGDATSSLSGKFNAFATGATGSKPITVGLSSSTATAGLKTGTVTIDNLDVTTGGGAGRGANDANDVITVTMSVLDHANASFAAESDVNSLLIDFGTIAQGEAPPLLPLSIYNLPTTASYTAGLDLDGVAGSGDFGVLTTSLAPFGGLTTLAEGLSRTFTASMSTSTVGAFSATYMLSFSDENLPGAAPVSGLTLMLAGVVEAPDAPSADFDGNGLVDGVDMLAWQRGFGAISGAITDDGDANGDHDVDDADFAVWRQQFGTAGPGATLAPEPHAAFSMVSGLTILWMAAGNRRRWRHAA